MKLLLVTAETDEMTSLAHARACSMLTQEAQVSHQPMYLSMVQNEVSTQKKKISRF